MSISKSISSSMRNFWSMRNFCALGFLACGLAPALAQQVSPQTSPQASPTTPSEVPAKAAKPASTPKKVASKPAKSAELPAIGGPAIKQKAGEEKPKVKRPFGELEGWSSTSEAEKKVLPTPRDQSSTQRSPVQFNGSGNMGMGIGF
jgi:hypothetical protein